MQGKKFSAIQLRAMEAAGVNIKSLKPLTESQKGLLYDIRVKDEKSTKLGDKDCPEALNVEEKLGERERVLKELNNTIEKEEYVEEGVARVTQNGNIYIVGFTWLGKYMLMKLFFPEVKRPSRKEVQVALEKIYPGSKVQRFDQAPYNPSEPMLYMGVQENKEVEFDEAVYGGGQKKEAPKDTRMTVTAADKRGNTSAYQKYKAGDKRYKAAGHMKEASIQEKKDKDTPDQVKAVIAFDKARKGTDDATYDSEHGEKKKAKKERDYAKWQRDKGTEDAQKSGHPWKHAKGSTREKEGKKSIKAKHIKD